MEQVRKANQFSIMADEATDSASDDQLAISVQYINPLSKDIEGRFFAFSECITGVTSETIAN